MNHSNEPLKIHYRMDDRIISTEHYFIGDPRRKMYGRNRWDPVHFQCIPLERAGNTPESSSWEMTYLDQEQQQQ